VLVALKAYFCCAKAPPFIYVFLSPDGATVIFIRYPKALPCQGDVVLLRVVIITSSDDMTLTTTKFFSEMHAALLMASD